FYVGTFSLEGKIDLAAIKQSEARLTGATGEGMADFFDVEMEKCQKHGRHFILTAAHQLTGK
ncbi:MAG: hypothetical protein HOC08_00410, partial [Deltaproteobacteria bacterium]|nr:hypothetical protein [Deltaproteobacteria bacterium]